MIMRQSEVTCPKCHSGYRRIELVSRKGSEGEFHCVSCDQVLEVFDGSTYVAIRLTVRPEKLFE
jgi:transposase-like protein